MSGINLHFFNERDAHRTLALEVEDRKFWVPRDTLAMFSPHFKAMVEANQDVIRLPDKKASDILELLLVLMPTPDMKEIDEKNVDTILELANEYQIEYLKRRCETVFIKKMADYQKGDKGMLSLLRIASDHKLDKFLEPLVRRCAENFSLQELQAVFDVLKSEVVAALMLYKTVLGINPTFCQFHVSRENCPGMGQNASNYYLPPTNSGRPTYYGTSFSSNHPFVICIRCNLKRCIECNGANIMPGVCSGAKNMNVKDIEDSVRALLDRI